MSAVYVGSLLSKGITSLHTREFTPEKGHTSARTVESFLLLVLTSEIIREFIPEKGLMSAANVANPSSKNVTFLPT